MLNIFKIKKALRQAKKHVEEVNQLNDELNRIGKEQNRIIADQQAKIESSIQLGDISKVFIIEFENDQELRHVHEAVFTTEESAKQYLSDAGYKENLDPRDVASFENADLTDFAWITEKNLIVSDMKKE